MRKILIFLLLLFSYGSVYGGNSSEQNQITELMNSMSDSQKEQFLSTEISNSLGNGTTTVKQAIADGYLSDGYTGPSTQGALDAAGSIINSSSSSKEEIASSDSSTTSSSTSSSNNTSGLSSSTFTIDVSDISPGIDITSKASTTEGKVNYLLGTVIQKMMIALGSLSVLIMTIGGGYIIMHNGQDELLSKGKSIFMSGVYAMSVALSSYYIISIVRYLLYS